MTLTESDLSKLQPILDKFSMKLRASWKIAVALFERELMGALSETSCESLKSYAVDIARRCPEYDPLMVYWIEKTSVMTSPSDYQKLFLAKKYMVTCWLSDEPTRAASKAYLAKALQS
jgi:hypothetical protein